MEIKTGRKVIDIEIKALNLLKKYISEDFVKVVNLLLNNKGKIVVSGIGKSGHIASKIASTLSSVGSPSFYIHPSEANHGDLGMLEQKDAVILISNSGETSELINLIFAELEITFHNQFHKAFPDEETLSLAKQLWLAKLEKFDNEIIFKAIDKIIETSKYLPSLSAVLNQIKELKFLQQKIIQRQLQVLTMQSFFLVSFIAFID